MFVRHFLQRKLPLYRDFLRQLSIYFYLGVFAAMVLIGFNEYGYQTTRLALGTVKQLDEQRRALDKVRQLVLNAEASQRGFLLTGRSAYLQPYLDANAAMEPALESVSRYYSGSAAAMANFAKLSASVQRRMAEMEVAVKLRRAAPDQGNWLATINTDVGKESMDDIRHALELLSQENRKQIEIATKNIHNSVAFSRLAITLTALAALLALYLLLRQQKAVSLMQAQQRAELAAERDSLELAVRDRTKRMTVLANHLLSVQEDERARLARELHDEMGALLTAAKLDLARIRSRIPPTAGNEAVQERLDHLNESLNACAAFKRRITEDLLPSSLSHLGLDATLEIQAQEFQRRTGIITELLLDAPPCDSDTNLAIFRLVQESLNNIAKHAQAKKVTISLQAQANHLDLRIADDGQGFDPADALHKSHGLPGMLHRVEALAGKLHIDSAPGMGTRIHAALPLPQGNLSSRSSAFGLIE